jgi:hypothetical protein
MEPARTSARPTFVKGRLAALPLLSVAWLAGCAHYGSNSATAPGLSLDAAATAGLLVTTTYRYDSPWFAYREGARAELILRDEDGDEVDRRVVRPGKSVEFRDLPVGAYRLEPALRPCDGNCGYLDPRLDDCAATVKVTRSVRVRVDFVAGSSCTLHGPSVA